MKKKIIGMTLAAAIFVGFGCKATTVKAVEIQSFSNSTVTIQESVTTQRIEPQPW